MGPPAPPVATPALAARLGQAEDFEDEIDDVHDGLPDCLVAMTAAGGPVDRQACDRSKGACQV